MSEFELDPRLDGDTLALMELGLCSVRLMNDARYPWLVLVPRVPGKVEIFDLDEADQRRLHDEIRQCARALTAHCQPDKLNIAALGNQVNQLHIHIIARFQNDASWPDPVWGKLPPLSYGNDAADTIKDLVSRMKQIDH